MYYTCRNDMSNDFKTEEHKRSTPLSYRPSKAAWKKILKKRDSLRKQGKKATIAQIIEACILGDANPSKA